MRYNIHTNFILSPITDILKDIVSASSCIGNGIETFPLCDYIMQSVFIKMTGFQEQKMKCICWEIATFDYEYRYELTKTPLGECSNYNNKEKVYKSLIKQIEKYNLNFDLIKENSNKQMILSTSISEIIDTFSNTNLSIWVQKDFLCCDLIWEEIEIKDFLDVKSKLFSNSVKDIYIDFLYKQRNRIAHNATSYQQNLPNLKTLANENFKYNNYFVYFALLNIIDKIFIMLYSKYLEVLNNQ